MDFEWVAIALGDVTWISLAFFLGFLARLISLPPLIGFLATVFLLNYLGITSGETLQKLADLGITLLLFTVGRKISFSERIAAIARFPDEVNLLQNSGATAVFNISTEAGAGFAEHVEARNQI